MSNQNQVSVIIGRVATDAQYRTRFFKDVEQIIAQHSLDAVESETLRGMAKCPVTRMGTAMLNKSHNKYEANARKLATAV